MQPQPPPPSSSTSSTSLFDVFELQNSKISLFFRGRSFDLGFLEGEHHRRLLCTPTSLFCSLFQVLGDLDLELDLWWRREKTDSVLHLLEFLCNTTIAGMERIEWMYQISRLSQRFIDQVKKFVHNTQKHTLSVNQQGIICPCSYCKNELILESGEVQSHLIKWGFIEEYMVWRFHGEADASGGVFGGNSSPSMKNKV